MELCGKFEKGFSRVFQSYFTQVLFLHEAFYQLLVSSSNVMMLLRVGISMAYLWYRVNTKSSFSVPLLDLFQFIEFCSLIKYVWCIYVDWWIDISTTSLRYVREVLVYKIDVSYRHNILFSRQDSISGIRTMTLRKDGKNIFEWCQWNCPLFYSIMTCHYNAVSRDEFPALKKI